MPLSLEEQARFDALPNEIEDMKKDISDYKKEVKEKGQSTTDETHSNYLASLNFQLTELLTESRVLRTIAAAPQPQGE